MRRADLAQLAANRATLTATVIPQASQGTQPAIVNNYHGPQFHFSGADSEERAARVIRRALTEPAPEEYRS